MNTVGICLRHRNPVQALAKSLRPLNNPRDIHQQTKPSITPLHHLLDRESRFKTRMSITPQTHFRPFGWLIPKLLLQLLLVLQEADGVPLRHLLHIHLRHTVVVLQVYAPGGVKVLELHVMSDLGIPERGTKAEQSRRLRDL